MGLRPGLMAMNDLVSLHIDVSVE